MCCSLSLSLSSVIILNSVQVCVAPSLSLLPEECAEVWSFDRPAAPAEGHHLVDGLGRVLRTLQHLTILNSASKWFSVSVNYKYSSGQCTIQCICIRSSQNTVL